MIFIALSSSITPFRCELLNSFPLSVWRIRGGPYLVAAVAHPTPSIQFADDIALYQSGSNTATISLGLSSSVTALADWLENRGLILNERKSQVLSICGRDAQTSIAANCHQTRLPACTAAKYLGLTITEQLTWDHHIHDVTAKVNRKVGALWRARQSLSQKARVQYLNSVVMPDLLYGSVAYSTSLSAFALGKLQRLQNHAIRAVFSLPPTSSVSHQRESILLLLLLLACTRWSQPCKHDPQLRLC